MNRLYSYAGIFASIVLIAFGAGSLYMGFDGRDQVRDDLAREQIVGTEDSTIPGQKVDTGSEAQAFAAVIRKHTLEATGGQTYAQMGRFLDENGKPTSDERRRPRVVLTSRQRISDATAGYQASHPAATSEGGAMSAETGQITGTKDKDYNIIWFTEQCLSNTLRMEQYAADAERDGDTELAEFFRRAQGESRKGAEQGKALLKARLGS